MSCGSGQTTGCVYSGADVTFLARIYRQTDGSLLTQADISRIQQTIWDRQDPSQPLDQVDLNVASVFFDTLQNDDRWTIDNTGFNFSALVGGSKLGAELLQVEFVFFMVDGSVLPIEPYQLQQVKVLSAP